MQQQLPPAAIDAEAAALGVALVDGRRADELLSALEPNDFFSESHRRIYEAVRDLRGAGQAVDLVTVLTRLRDNGTLRTVTSSYLTQVANQPASLAALPTYSKQVKDKSVLRQLQATCRKLEAQAYDAVDPAPLLEELATVTQDLREHAETTTHGVELGVAIERVLQAATSGKVPVVRTGYPALDQLLGGGFGHGDLCLLAGRPSMGKTAASLGIAVRAARAGIGVHYASLEMPTNQMAARCACSEARVSIQALRNGTLTPADWERLNAALAALRELPLIFDDRAGQTVLDVHAGALTTARGLSAKGVPLGLVMIDYLGLMRAHKALARASEEAQMASFARGSKWIARDLRIPVIALAQLNRAVESRKAHRPQLSDLRDSGQLEEAADEVAFLYRQDYYRQMAGDETRDNILEIILAKNRNGPTGTARMGFLAEYARMENAA